jgi:hypothetical protein
LGILVSLLFGSTYKNFYAAVLGILYQPPGGGRPQKTSKQREAAEELAAEAPDPCADTQVTDRHGYTVLRNTKCSRSPA